jgi:hypothetical protein
MIIGIKERKGLLSAIKCQYFNGSFVVPENQKTNEKQQRWDWCNGTYNQTEGNTLMTGQCSA